MSSVNSVTLVGRVGRDPEIRYTPSGDAVATFSLATSEQWKGRDGQRQERTEWHRVEAWKGTAEVIKNYVDKGRLLYVQGSIRTDEWEDKEGNKRKATKIVAQRIVLLGPGGKKKNEEVDAPQLPLDQTDDEVPF